MENSILSLRQSRLVEILPQAGLRGLVLNPGPSLVYLTGLHFHLSERPVVAFFPSAGVPTLALPELEMQKVKDLPFRLKAFPYGENPADWAEVFRQAAHAAGVNEGDVGVEPTRLRFLELRLLEAAAPQASFLSAEITLASLRMCKDLAELAKMRKAVQIAQDALQAILPVIMAGVTEAHLAEILVMELLRKGSDPLLPFEPIVSSGPNSANPHATPTDRLLQPGDLLVIDWGASHGGYYSDLTRTFAIGPVETEFAHIAQVVEQANAAGRAAARPGLPAKVVDQAARNVIDAAGYGVYFTHRTGHGLGMESHEQPYMRSDNELILQPGMTFTVEPGIYLPGRGGVRIEDDVVITDSGAESLSNYPRPLHILKP